MKAGDPFISVDTKKKEPIGNFKNDGRIWCEKPTEVNAHDFRSEAKYISSPYSIYAPALNRALVCVGISADTPEFAVDSIRHWCRTEGIRYYSEARRLLVLADAGGSNGYRPRLFKCQLQKKIANDLGLEVTVCHFPTGASKWNPVEHDVHCYITTNWAGVPLRSLDIMLACIRGTKTQAGLRVRATLNTKRYRKGIKVSDGEMRSLNLRKHKVCPDWNYTISPIQE